MKNPDFMKKLIENCLQTFGEEDEKILVQRESFAALSNFLKRPDKLILWM